MFKKGDKVIINNDENINGEVARVLEETKFPYVELQKKYEIMPIHASEYEPIPDPADPRYAMVDDVLEDVDGRERKVLETGKNVVNLSGDIDFECATCTPFTYKELKDMGYKIKTEEVEDEKGSGGLWDKAGQIAEEYALDQNAGSPEPAYADERLQEIIYGHLQELHSQSEGGEKE